MVGRACTGQVAFQECAVLWAINQTAGLKLSLPWKVALPLQSQRLTLGTSGRGQRTKPIFDPEKDSRGRGGRRSNKKARAMAEGTLGEA